MASSGMLLLVTLMMEALRNNLGLSGSRGLIRRIRIVRASVCERPPDENPEDIENIGRTHTSMYGGHAVSPFSAVIRDLDHTFICEDTPFCRQFPPRISSDMR
jgi:hypothetical protein